MCKEGKLKDPRDKKYFKYRERREELITGLFLKRGFREEIAKGFGSMMYLYPYQDIAYVLQNLQPSWVQDANESYDPELEALEQEVHDWPEGSWQQNDVWGNIVFLGDNTALEYVLWNLGYGLVKRL